MPREIEQDNAILHHEPHEQNQSHEARDVQRCLGHNQNGQRPNKRERRGEQHHQRLHKTPELQHHHGHHTHGRECEHDQQGAEGPLLTGIAPPQLHTDPIRGRIRVQNGTHVSHRLTERTPRNARRDREQLLLVLAQVFASHILSCEIRKRRQGCGLMRLR